MRLARRKTRAGSFGANTLDIENVLIRVDIC
jgi:hypothetical protein